MAFDGQGAAGGAASGAATGTMIMPGWGTAIGGVAGGLMGGFMGGKKSNPAEQAAKEALAYYSSIGIPSVEAQQLVLEELKSQGTLTPELEANILQPDSELNTIATDPSLKQAQNEALGNLQRQYSQGLTEQEQADILGIRKDSAQQARASQEDILQNNARRGMSGSGAELAAQLAAGQASADRQSTEDMKMAATIAAARQAAAEKAGSMATGMRDESFGEQSKVKSAQDAINSFNTQSQQNTQMRNIASKNSAQATNLQEKQRLADSNVGLHNQEQQYNKELIQKEFDNKMNLANAKAAARTGQVKNAFAQSQANNEANAGMFQNLLGGASTIASAYKGSGTAAPALSKQDQATGNEIMNAKADKRYDANGRVIG